MPVSQARVNLKLAGIETFSAGNGTFVLYQDYTRVEIQNATDAKLSFDGRIQILQQWIVDIERQWGSERVRDSNAGKLARQCSHCKI